MADGRAVDWAALGGRVQGSQALEQLECLRIIGAIADLHRSGDESTQPLDETGPLDSSHAPPENAGEPWGRYRLLGSVGSGTFGSVYRAWDPELEREVAIKILHRHVADAELTKRLLQEGRALAKVRHPNVVSVYGVESNENHVGLVMEFVRGETLEKTMSGGHKLNPREAANVGQDVCRALAAVHHAGFVHRDVTSRNIMRDLGGRIVLMDFGTGLQTAEGAKPGFGKIAGTPMYMAPEVLAGQPPSPCSDVYGVGVLLYYLVTRKYPVEGRTMDELRAAHMVGRRTPLAERDPDLPIAFIRAVEHALAANPQQRCPSAGLLLQELAAAVDSKRRSTSSYVLWTLEAVAGVMLGVTALGAVNSRYFNHTLGRLDFAGESILDWFNFGVSATIAPAFIFTFALLGIGVLGVVTRFLLSVSATARRLKTALVNVARRSHLDDVATLSSFVLLLSAATLIATWWYFSSFLSSLIAIGYISTAPDGSLSFLSPRLSPYHYLYRKAFTAVFVVCLLLWYPVIRLAIRKDEPINRSILTGGAAVLILSLLLLDFPYRMILRGKKDFEVANWSGESCYVLGERQAHLLLFCPKAVTPRNRIVRNDDPNLQRLGILQDIFTNIVPPK